MNVDLPHPDGPINAVTVPRGNSIEISSRTCFEPNQACTFLASRPVPAIFSDLPSCGRRAATLASELVCALAPWFVTPLLSIFSLVLLISSSRFIPWLSD